MYKFCRFIIKPPFVGFLSVKTKAGGFLFTGINQTYSYYIYSLTFLMVLYMLSGIFHPAYALIATIVISLSPFIWYFHYRPMVRDRITEGMTGKT